MILKCLLNTVILLCTFFVGYGQTTLVEGDIAIVGLDVQSEDFMFVTFVDLEAGTEIYFTDEEVDGDYTIGAGEGTILYTAPFGDILAGTVISYVTNTSNFDVTSDGNIQLANDGDGLLAYQGASVGNVTIFLHAVGENLDDIGTFPNGFSNYLLIGTNNGEYFGVRAGETAETYLMEVNAVSNWVTGGSSVSPFDLTYFNFDVEDVTGCSELFISEYIEGSSNNKYIEIYNPTSSIVTLTGNYSIQVFHNSSSSGTTINLTGSISPFGVFVLSNNSASLGVDVGQSTGVLNFNGNDAVALANSTTIIDLVGVIGDNTDFAKDSGLKRKANVKNPTITFDNSEWDTLVTDDVSNLGIHFGDCGYVCDALNTTTWNSVGWDNGSPSIYTAVVINDNYDTSVNGSFQACSLKVKENVLLAIANSTYVEVQNDVEVKGDLIVETEASFLQNNDIATFEVLGDGNSSVNKTSAPISAWYEYTYWSSPVEGVAIGDALVDVSENRRFWFKGENWLDSYKETDNNNAQVAGQDGVDDNGDDWQYANLTDVMIPGVGYAATYSSSKFTTSGQQYSYNFSGAFNNGIITVPVYRNDTETEDSNLNFIGNPYSSAIDVDVFFNENVYDADTNPTGVLDGVIYLWSQNTAPSGVVNGNEDSNFSQSDYAMINGVGGISAGGEGLLPERSVSSCQGFFVTFSNNTTGTTPVSSGIVTADVIFNNSMRINDHNNQFFKSVKKNKVNKDLNKLWVNLTSDNGLFSQVLVGYVNGATDNLDTSFYDINKNPTSEYSIIYSIIEGNESKLAIQGKSKRSLDLYEEIFLGFDTYIEDSIVYELSIAKIEGRFLEGVTMYLDDDLTGLSHNLSEGSYNFTSEVGEFKYRFKIRFFSEEIIEDEEGEPINILSISNLDNDNLVFSTSDDIYIEDIQIIDFLGKKLIEFEGGSDLETVNISSLSSAIYFVRVKLSNHEVIVKKLLKK